MEILVVTGLMLSISLFASMLIVVSEIGFLKARVKNLESDRANREMGK